ncbi:RagB/SusD family nutrient uptake outer membrane protein [Chitinophaga pendula]|uniref:RagB/SusD family nutrient uptake outer membrane protein n=1 Tax=Chitinophaga TaxID=79328 RepID=UPI000BAF8012|nr:MULTISPECIES: RagB/SusD family nutrient uptake outer membrane protein [Chitinophaga]ASZ12239.1 RagB/SusD family nutrient uptake outer membrane protein [Chitinophaga sp. MD30]UCJ04729.1 RagB/SusD family nutrient uptake outer membrane protein [Chitinophaga pendula]
MKTKQILYTLLLAAATTSACKKVTGDDFLDKTDTGTIDRQKTFADSALTMQFLNGVYRQLSFTYFIDNGLFGGGIWSFSDATDDSEIRWSGNTAQTAQAYNGAQFAGVADFSRMRADHWNIPYDCIRRANIFLSSVDNGPLSASRKAMAKAEIRFLRAYFYFHLLRTHGGIPLIGDRLYGLEDKFDQPRASFEECVQYITKELDDAAAILPVEHTPDNYGRPTKGAAMAVKAKLLLMAASPLFNGGNLGASGDQQKLLGYSNFGNERWKTAADAMKAVIDMGAYDLVEDNTSRKGNGFYLTFLQRKNREHIFQVMQGANRTFENLLLPASRAGQTYSFPTQQLVDAFPMANGKQPDQQGSGYNEAQPYQNRDPRFYFTVLYNGASWLMRASNRQEPVWLYQFAPQDGLNTNSNATRTGYLWRKMMDENAGGNYGVEPTRCLPVIRFAEILLGFAEAANEYEGPTPAVYDAVERIRRRAGLSPYQLPTGLSKEQMRDAIRNERRVELAFEEGHRFFDLLRWKMFDKLVNGDMYGMRWTKVNETTFTPQRFVFETRVFKSPQMYFMPIPQAEINKAPMLTQNPGW